jgi:hypothetical protein
LWKRKLKWKKRRCRWKREGEDTGEFNMYNKRSVPGYFQYACEQLANDEKN